MAEKYQKHDLRSHVRARPDTYIGSIANTKSLRWIIKETDKTDKTDKTQKKTEETEESEEQEEASVVSAKSSDALCGLEAVRKECSYNPGLEQCIVELIVNAIDHAQRTVDDKDPVTKIEIDYTDNSFTIRNNGTGIPLEMHPVHKVYVPELIFGNMLTSSNYDDTQKRTWGGTNGIGAKAVNIFSNEFSLDMCTNNMRYTQTFSFGMTKKTEPVIHKMKHKDYVQISFKPDFAAFGLKSFTKNTNNEPVDNIDIIKKRVYDASAVTSKKVSVTVNGFKIPIKELKDYCSLFIGPGSKKVIFEQENWSVVVAVNPFEEATSIGFVNGIFTEENGTHVDCVENQITKKVLATIQDMPKIKKQEIVIKPSYIKDGLIFFVKCLVENPRFNSQTKTRLTTPIKEFPISCTVSDDVINKIAKLDFVDNAIKTAQIKQLKDIKKISGTKKSRLVDVPKLDDANWAGTKKSHLCTLILTEGDSAKSAVMSGLSVIGNDAWGVFPLKGKILNVRNATFSKLMANEEIVNINKILGLSYGLDDRSKLRYSKIMIMTDADVDGSHIKGLLLNYFAYYCPKIMNGLVTSMLTPIVKVTLPKTVKAAKKSSKAEKTDKDTLSFYDYATFENWKKTVDASLKYSTKYYKGLGTSTGAEFKEYFRNINQINYNWDEDRDLKAIDLAFNETRSNDRKDWIANGIKRTEKEGFLIDYTNKNVNVDSFINNELVTYSIYACQTKLPNMIDGLKVSQRKVLYGSLLLGIHSKKKEIKVAQLASSVAKDTHYHHGEVSLNDTIVNMARDFVGSGNLQLLFPSGQFGSRISGGKDASSPRYIFTFLKQYVSILFNDFDNGLLDYNYEDNQKIEPKFYVPILPMVLLNGADGIATGWASDVPCFNAKDIIDRIKKLLKNPDYMIEELVPYYNGFRGTIVKKEAMRNKWSSVGLIEKVSPKRVLVKELPIGYWYSDFKEKKLKKLEADDVIDTWTSKLVSINGLDYEEFDITFNQEQDNPIKLLELETAINGTNMVGFDSKGLVKKFDSAEEILWHHFEYRLEFYDRRKKSMEQIMATELRLISEKARFIKLVNDGTIVILKQKIDNIEKTLEKHNFKRESGSDRTDRTDRTEMEDPKESYNYLLGIGIRSFTDEKVTELDNSLKKLSVELDILKVKSPRDLWNEDLAKLESIIDE